ncbi:MAG: hypothetical protein KDA25_12580 [Phycisphaerales bacterium]|nr:hypothetical protein [Phycisphaerales bacterium]
MSRFRCGSKPLQFGDRIRANARCVGVAYRELHHGDRIAIVGELTDRGDAVGVVVRYAIVQERECVFEAGGGRFILPDG